MFTSPLRDRVLRVRLVVGEDGVVSGGVLCEGFDGTRGVSYWPPASSASESLCSSPVDVSEPAVEQSGLRYPELVVVVEVAGAFFERVGLGSEVAFLC